MPKQKITRQTKTKKYELYSSVSTEEGRSSLSGKPTGFFKQENLQANFKVQERITRAFQRSMFPLY